MASSHPSSSFTFSDLRIRIAEYLSVAYYGTAGTGKAQEPTSTHDLDMVDRVINDGYRRFLFAHDWTFLNEVAELTLVTATEGTVGTGGTGSFTDTTIDDAADTYKNYWVQLTASNGSTKYGQIQSQTSGGVITFYDGSIVVTTGDTYSIAAEPAIRGENDKYIIADDFSGIIHGRVTYASGSNTGVSCLEETDEHSLRTMKVNGTTTGDPYLFAVRPTSPEDHTQHHRWEFIVYPKPTAARTLLVPYRRDPPALVDGHARPRTPHIHDMTLLACCRSEAERTRHDETGIEETNYQNLLKRSLQIDGRMAPKRKGFMTNPEGFGGLYFPHGTVDSYNGTEITF